MSESVTLTQQEGFRFANDFGSGIPVMHSDEAAPLGGGTGPTPVQLLEAAVGNCLAASLLFALRKFKQAPEPIRARVDPEIGRNEHNRLRVKRLMVRLEIGVPGAQLQHLDKALSQFEDFCTVTASVRASLPVDVEVYDSLGERLK